MIIEKNIDLRLFSTMRLGGRARHAYRIKNKNDIVEAAKFARDNGLRIIVIGSGSNIIWKDSGFDGLLLINEIHEMKTEDFQNYKLITVGAGVNWDSFVDNTVEMGLTGIEALSLIPGTVGATPVQNVGAYGQEVSQTIETIEAFDIKASQFITFNNEDCDFKYRSSIFNKTEKHRYIIINVSFRLSKDFPTLPLYPAVANYFVDNSIEVIDPRTIRSAVVEIRKNKLPNPNQVSNNGSFFSNPIISSQQFNVLKTKFPNIVYWATEDGQYKLSGAWLIDKAGFGNYKDKETGIATWPNQSLVLINESAESTADLMKFKLKIITKIEELFNITLEQEPELLP